MLTAEVVVQILLRICRKSVLQLVMHQSDRLWMLSKAFLRSMKLMYKVDVYKVDASYIQYTVR